MLLTACTISSPVTVNFVWTTIMCSLMTTKSVIPRAGPGTQRLFKNISLEWVLTMGCEVSSRGAEWLVIKAWIKANAVRRKRVDRRVTQELESIKLGDLLDGRGGKEKGMTDLVRHSFQFSRKSVAVTNIIMFPITLWRLSYRSPLHTSQAWWPPHCSSQMPGIPLPHSVQVLFPHPGTIFLHVATWLAASPQAFAHSNSSFSVMTSPSVLLSTAPFIFILALLSFLLCFVFLYRIYQHQTHIFICFVSSPRSMSLRGRGQRFVHLFTSLLCPQGSRHSVNV